jgi:hypothetical protein
MLTAVDVGWRHVTVKILLLYIFCNLLNFQKVNHLKVRFDQFGVLTSHWKGMEVSTSSSAISLTGTCPPLFPTKILVSRASRAAYSGRVLRRVYCLLHTARPMCGDNRAVAAHQPTSLYLPHTVFESVCGSGERSYENGIE